LRFFSFKLFRTFLKPSLALAGVVALIHSSVFYFETPWTSTVTAAAVACILWLVVSKPPSIGTSIVVGLCIAATFGARMGDVAMGFTVLAAGVLTTRRTRTGLAHCGISIVVFAISLSVLLAINYHLSGSLFGTYFSSVRNAGFDAVASPWKLYGYVFDPFTFAGETNALARPMIAVVPGLLLAIPGLALMGRRHSAVMWAFIACIAGWLFIYTGYVAVSPLTLKFLSMHYAKVLFPVLIGSSMGFVEALAEGMVNWRLLGACTVLLVGCMLLAHLGSERIRPGEAEVTASENTADAWKAIDGNEATRWDSGRPQEPGMRFDIDLRKSRFVLRIPRDGDQRSELMSITIPK
jgi:hypothetical protein